MTMTLALAACASKGPAALDRDLPAYPTKFSQRVPAPALTPTCRYPWVGVPGCKGEDVRAMLKLTGSAYEESGDRIEGGAGWYAGVRKHYKYPQRPRLWKKAR